MTASFPSTLPLTGADHFLCALGRLSRHISGGEAACRIDIHVDGPLDEKHIAARFRSLTVVEWLCHVNVHTTFPGALPCWRSSGNNRGTAVSSGATSIHNITTLGPDGVPRMLGFKIVNRPDQSAIFTLIWHHSIIDAHGAEMFVKAVAGAVDPEPMRFFPAAPGAPPPLVDRLNAAKAVKNHMKQVSSPAFATLPAVSRRTPATTRYKVLEISGADLERCDARAKALGAGVRRSLFYLGATVRGFDSMLRSMGISSGDLVVPMPLDRRKRGAFGPVVSNHVCFYFYRIPKDVLADQASTLSTLSAQMQAMMRSRFHESYACFSDLCRRLPIPLYLWLLKRPTRGRFASFFFSDTGESMNDLTHFMGRRVTKAIHYPPNFFPPGFTVVFSRNHGVLSVSIAYSPDIIADECLQQFIHRLRSDLGICGED